MQGKKKGVEDEYRLVEVGEGDAGGNRYPFQSWHAPGTESRAKIARRSGKLPEERESPGLEVGRWPVPPSFCRWILYDCHPLLPCLLASTFPSLPSAEG